MKSLILPVALLVAGCDGPRSATADKSDAAVTTPATPAAVADPQRQIGTVSGLSGATSSLSGTVTGFAVTETATMTVATLAADTLFDFDKDTLTPAAESNLSKVAELVGRGGAGTVTVTGYTDAKGSAAYNLALSLRRAQAVVSWLKGRPGLDARLFAVDGRGAADPVAPNAKADGSDDPDGRARNRRVIVAIPK